MENIYQDIAARTQGDIYIGVVGPVRTGKSTFIKRFMDMAVIPNIENDYKKERANDELPQSSAGRTIMTTEPKFIPDEAVTIKLGDSATMNVKMIDCVGYIVDGALGHIEDGMARMVKTPWLDDEIEFVKAAEIGTRKVISEHSTIGIVVTTDGSFGEIPREDYIKAEERVINELKEIDKPFVVLLNSSEPQKESTALLKKEMEMKYLCPVIAVNCAELTHDDIKNIMDATLFEFPVSEIGIKFPDWVDTLESKHWLREKMLDLVCDSFLNVKKIREIKPCISKIKENELVFDVKDNNINLGTGEVLIEILTNEDLFYKILGETSGTTIDSKESLVKMIKEMSEIKREYDKISSALSEVRLNGYGVVTPSIDELTLEEPEIIKQGGRFGVRLKASAPSIHMLRADVETEVNPIVGTEKQSEELVKYLLDEFEANPKEIWQSNIFGKSLHELVNEGLKNKLERMPEDARGKIRETLTKIVNEGSGGLICIIL